MQVSFADTLVETVFFMKKGPNTQNLRRRRTCSGGWARPTPPKKKPHYYAWQGVNGKEVVDVPQGIRGPEGLPQLARQPDGPAHRVHRGADEQRH